MVPFIRALKPGPLKECSGSADIILHEMEVPKLKKKFDFSQGGIIIAIINKGPCLLTARFRFEARPICQEWQPQVWNHENFFERRVSLWLVEL